MKPVKWLVLLLVLVTAALILMRQKNEDAIAPTPASPSAEAPAEINPIPAAPTAPPEAATASVAAQSQQPQSQPQDELKYGNHLQVIVQNESGQSLEGAAVRTSFRAEQRRPALTNFNRTFITSSQGIADVLWPMQPFQQLELLVSKDDYESRKMVWDLKAGDGIPPSYSVKLKGAVRVGGFVVDPEGNPVAEATVTLSRFWRGGEERKNQGEEATFPTQKHTTGPDGRWTARNLPVDLLERIFITGNHSNFISVTVSMDAKPQIEQELRAGTYKLELKRGLEVRGFVLDEQRQPIAGAQVWAGRRFSRERQTTKTDEQGRFTFRNVNEGKVDFSAVADGFSPEATTHNVRGTGTEEIIFQLVRGSVIRGTVQDESSQPIEGVRVVLAGSPGDESYDRYEFSTTTDREGKFEWKSAPNRPMPFYFGKIGYQQKRGVQLKPGEDNVITLRLNRQVQGQVLDAETEKPVTRFTVAAGRHVGPNQFYADSQDSKEFKSELGLFTLEIHEEEQNAIQATASGYAEQTQKLPPAEDREVSIVFKMKLSPALAGTVVTPEGQPVSGASVALVDSEPGGRSVQFSRGRIRSSGSRTKLVTTDAAGRFEIPSPPEVATVVAANGAGYGSASVAEIKTSGILMIQRFGRIEGVLMQGLTPGASQELLLSSANAGIYFEFETTKQTTDAEGRFVFENVPAGTTSIMRLVKTSSRSWAHSHRTDVVVTSGQTTQVVLGGVDATVQGQVRFESAPPATEYTITAELSTAMPQIPPGLTPEERTAFVRSSEWKEQVKNRKHYTALVGDDGTLTLDSVAPGQYTVRVTAHKKDEGPLTFPLAQGDTTVTVPVGADPGTPIQIGEVVLKLAK